MLRAEFLTERFGYKENRPTNGGAISKFFWKFPDSGHVEIVFRSRGDWIPLDR
jgi:hypothetical protein